MMPATAPLVFTAARDAMGEMDAWLSAFAHAHGLTEEVREELRVCLHELAANVILHGGQEGGPRTIEVTGHMEGTRAVLEFSDNAPAFDPLARDVGPATGTMETVAIGGLGLHLVRSFTDELAYRRDAGWNRLTLVRGPR